MNPKLDTFIVTALITADTPYELLAAQHLIPSLDKLKIPYYIEAMENQHNWLKNVAMKPLVILNAMEKYPNLNIVCLDVDAEVLQFPSLFNSIPEEFDIACHILDWDSWYGYSDHVKELLTGTILIKNTEKNKELVKEWYVRSTNSIEWEQKVLQKLIIEKYIKVFELPVDYCYIKSLPNGQPPLVRVDNPIIIHHQASRKLKRFIR